EPAISLSAVSIACRSTSRLPSPGPGSSVGVGECVVEYVGDSTSLAPCPDSSTCELLQPVNASASRAAVNTGRRASTERGRMCSLYSFPLGRGRFAPAQSTDRVRGQQDGDPVGQMLRPHVFGSTAIDAGGEEDLEEVPVRDEQRPPGGEPGEHPCG